MREARQECSKVYNRGHWSKAEHERFIQGVQQHGRDWKKVSEEVGSRSSNQNPFACPEALSKARP